MSLKYSVTIEESSLKKLWTESKLEPVVLDGLLELEKFIRKCTDQQILKGTIPMYKVIELVDRDNPMAVSKNFIDLGFSLIRSAL